MATQNIGGSPSAVFTLICRGLADACLERMARIELVVLSLEGTRSAIELHPQLDRAGRTLLRLKSSLFPFQGAGLEATRV